MSLNIKATLRISMIISLNVLLILLCVFLNYIIPGRITFERFDAIIFFTSFALIILSGGFDAVFFKASSSSSVQVDLSIIYIAFVTMQSGALYGMLLAIFDLQLNSFIPFLTGQNKTHKPLIVTFWAWSHNIMLNLATITTIVVFSTLFGGEQTIAFVIALVLTLLMADISGMFIIGKTVSLMRAYEEREDTASDRKAFQTTFYDKVPYYVFMTVGPVLLYAATHLYGRFGFFFSAIFIVVAQRVGMQIFKLYHKLSEIEVDELTGLRSIYGFRQDFEHNPLRKPYFAIFFHIDNFSNHLRNSLENAEILLLSGKELIRKIEQQQPRKTCSSYRLYRNEFFMIMRSQVDPTQVVEKMNEEVREIKKRLFDLGVPFAVTGCAMMMNHQWSIKELMHKAEQGLDHARENKISNIYYIEDGV